jgi:hypothetical protein
LDVKRVDATCGKLNCQRNAVQLTTDLANDGGLLVAEFEADVVGRRALHKELNRGILGPSGLVDSAT